MLNLSIPVLQIKTSGYKLDQIGTMEIIIRTATRTITKGNKDIEADNDVIMASLSESEAEILKRQGDQSVNISIRATNLDGIDISSALKVFWTKIGSRSGGGGSGGIDEEIIIKIQTDISDLQNSMSIGNNRVYLDYQNGKYGVNTDPNRGADTFSPFKSGADISDNVAFIDGQCDSSINEFSTITQIGVYVHVIESNSYWSELNIEEETFFPGNYEKLTVVVQEG